jgi:hypothetical protein
MAGFGSFSSAWRAGARSTNTRLELAQAIRKDLNRGKGEAPAFHAEAAVPATIHCRTTPLMSLIGKAI